MLEIDNKQLLSFDDKNKARILKLILQGIIVYKESDNKWDNWDTRIYEIN